MKTTSFIIPTELEIPGIKPTQIAYDWLDFPEGFESNAAAIEFDRRACADGFKQFLRHITNEELAMWKATEGVPPDATPPNSILVMELRPGQRFRQAVNTSGQGQFPSEN